MPIYEFLCQKCHKTSTVLVKSVAENFTPRCSACNSDDVIRTISTFAYHKSTQTIHEEYGEPQKFGSPDYYKDPRNIGRWTEKRFKDMGMEMPAQLKEEIQASREGELPKSLKDKL